jgi:hypothetical protein
MRGFVGEERRGLSATASSTKSWKFTELGRA